MATSTLPTGGMIDPTKQAEYPVLLGDRLAVKDRVSKSQLININYNHKTKSSSQQRQSTITRSSQSPDFYNLSITDKAENNTLTHLYEGSADPAQEAQESEVRDYVLVFDSDRKAFVLEPVATQLNFNLRSAPAKTGKQVIEQYEQLKTLQDDLQSSGDDLAPDGIAEEEDGAADESNPYDFRHFLPKAEDEENKTATGHATPEPLPSASKSDVPPAPATTKPAPSSKPRSDPQSNPPRPKKAETAKKKTESAKKEPAKKAEPTKKKEPPPAKPSPETEPRVEMEEVEEFPESKSSPSDTGTAALSSHKAVPSPGSNIIVDGDLIIDMGSPPPSRPAFKVNPAHFSSNHTPTNDAEDEEGEEDEEMEDLRLPSPARQAGQSAPVEKQEKPAPAEEEVEEDALAAEMEAAFEESAREEENARTQPYQQPPSRAYNAPSDDESEVSEEE